MKTHTRFSKTNLPDSLLEKDKGGGCSGARNEWVRLLVSLCVSSVSSYYTYPRFLSGLLGNTGFTRDRNENRGLNRKTPGLSR